MTIGRMMTRPHLLLALSLAGLTLLSACHRGAKSDDQRTAAGQVLPGSISDAMLPYDTLHSKPVLAPARAASEASSAASAGSGEVVAGAPAIAAEPVN